MKYSLWNLGDELANWAQAMCDLNLLHGNLRPSLHIKNLRVFFFLICHFEVICSCRLCICRGVGRGEGEPDRDRANRKTETPASPQRALPLPTVWESTCDTHQVLNTNTYTYTCYSSSMYRQCSWLVIHPALKMLIRHCSLPVSVFLTWCLSSFCFSQGKVQRCVTERDWSRSLVPWQRGEPEEKDTVLVFVWLPLSGHI